MTEIKTERATKEGTNYTQENYTLSIELYSLEGNRITTISPNETNTIKIKLTSEIYGDPVPKGDFSLVIIAEYYDKKSQAGVGGSRVIASKDPKVDDGFKYRADTDFVERTCLTRLSLPTPPLDRGYQSTKFIINYKINDKLTFKFEAIIPVGDETIDLSQENIG